MRHSVHTASCGRRAAGAARRASGARRATGAGPYHRTHAGRYFGGLWFKVFSERGPC